VATVVAVIALVAAAPRELAAETMESALARAYQGQSAAQRPTRHRPPERRGRIASAVWISAEPSQRQLRLPSNIQTDGSHSADSAELPNGVSYTVKGFTTPRSVGSPAGRRSSTASKTANKVRKAESQVSTARETLRDDGRVGAAFGGVRLHGHVPRLRNLEVQQNNIRVLQRTLKDTQNRFNAGQVTATDVAQAEAQLRQAKQTYTERNPR